MTENVQHNVYVVPANDPRCSPEDRRDHATVHVVNDEDTFYVQIFETREQIDGFVAKLREASKEAFGMPESTWAVSAARDIIERFSSGDIETADYRLRSFILAAAKIAHTDADFAEKICALMEPPRSIEPAEQSAIDALHRDGHRSVSHVAK